MRLLLRFTPAIVLPALVLVRTSSYAEVTDSSAIGFTVRQVVQIAAAPEAVYDRVVNDVAHWWNPDHTFSGDASNLSIEGKADGCFCEKLPHGGSVRHMTVVFASPGKLLRLDGAIGPMQSMAVTGSMTWTFTGSGPGTKLELTYSVGGYSPHGLQMIAIASDSVLKEQVGRLKSLIETGKAARAANK
jgi:uncharacterized protein YndB with AHSA1/START domain